MKKRIQHLFQRMLGFRNYLFWFSRFKIATLRWDAKEGDFLHFLNMIPAEGTVMDIGANIGIMTVPLARRCARVIAVEPIPENKDALKRILRFFRLHNVELLECALGAEDGELEMVMPEVSSVKMQGLSHVVHDSIEGYAGGGQTYKIPQRTLDGYWKEADRLDAIKIDVENFEYFVFKGGERMLAAQRPVIYAELWDNENRAKCFDLLGGMGYEIKVLMKGKLEAFDPAVHQKQNFFFVHPDKG